MSKPFSPWAFLRSVLERGAAVQQDYAAGNHGSYEAYSARLDAVAREFADKLEPLLAGVDGDDEPADADWLEKRGFKWSACCTAMYRMCGPIEVVVGGDVVMLEKDTHLSLHWSYPGPPKVTQYYGLDDNPTRAAVRRLCAALGEPLTEPPAK